MYARSDIVTGESSPGVEQFTGSVPEVEQPADPSQETNHGDVAGDLPNIHLSYRLDGKNYLQWAQLVQTFLKGKGKIAHLRASPPNVDHPLFSTWEIKDS